MIKTPSQNQFSQTNESDKTGNVYITKNINFDEVGYMKLSPRTVCLADSSVLTDLSNASGDGLVAGAFENALNVVWLCGTKNLYYSGASDLSTWTKDATTGTPTLNTSGLNDIIWWQGHLYVCNNANVYMYDNTTPEWTAVSTFNGRFMCDFVNLKQIAVAGTNEVKLFDASFAEAQTLSLPSNFTITSVAWNNLRLYIATINSSGDAVLFEWDGLSSEANYGYEVDGDKIYSVTKYKSGVALTTSRGEVLYCQGGLQNLAYFPIYFTDENWSNVFIETLSIRNPISHRGMLSDGNNIYFTLNAKNINIADDRNRPQWTNIMPSGVWCYNPKVGLTTKHTIGSGTVSRTNAITTGNVDTSTDVITIAGATAPVTGTPCFYNAGSVGNGTVIGGLKTGWRYFIIKVTDSTIKLATTKENAENGTAINLTGTGNNDQYITFHPNISFGGITNSATCLFKNGLLGVAGRAYTNRILVGGHIQVGTDTSLARASLHGIVSYQENRGYYISPKIMSSEVTDNMVNMIVKHKLLKNPEDKFIVKYRNVERVMPSYITANDSAITWTATDTFTSTNDLSDVLVGDEVEITSGAGAGYLAHVTSIEESSGTYTVEIDETIENISVNDRAFAVFDNWTKIKTVTSADATNHFEAPVAKQSTWTQFKIDIRGIDTTIEEIIFNNQVFTPVV